MQVMLHPAMKDLNAWVSRVGLHCSKHVGLSSDRRSLIAKLVVSSMYTIAKSSGATRYFQQLHRSTLTFLTTPAPCLFLPSLTGMESAFYLTRPFSESHTT
ncbi:hypothetical protein RSOL_520150 [Rhizoctonia solani AG-3 Rhs1AP]|uniref:Uncharacterized protein n=2 Tax=Rhizoctonia solani AG-3 TaxID=1086053 RepID=A0A074S3V0_9AGAM|nr:hypothetical protein RSOL_520150 [Rhizoctonia solani AG-3 Rhs1AP]KEP52215.1 hypothetical protein V565_048920 [Rhizoctonia solani 123E]